jgi:hypothetical protein
MMRLAQVFAEGGSTMYLILLLATAGHIVMIAGPAAGGFSRRERGLLFGAIALGIGLVTIAVGYYGYRHGLAMGERAIAFVSPDMRQRLLAQSEHEAARNFTFGLWACVLPSLVGAALLVRAGTLAASRDPALPPSR